MTMGIPQFFKYIRTKHAHILSKFDASVAAAVTTHSKTGGGGSGSQNICDHLFLDFNCAVHKCARKVVERLERQEAAPSTSASDGDPFSEAFVQGLVIEESCNFIDMLARSINPRNTLYVAIDGVPPRAKMVQQRNRRFLSHWSRTPAFSVSPSPPPPPPLAPWDSSCVTPGTDFMAALSKRIKQRFTTGKKYGGRVKVSDSDEPSEGEQKIYGEIRSGRYAGRTLVYGLDADLLILSALCLEVEARVPGLEVDVLRPCDDEGDDQFHIVNIGQLRDEIHAQIGAIDRATSMREYAVLCSLLGNDFVPGIACLPVCHESIQTLIDVYKSVAFACVTGDDDDDGGGEDASVTARLRHRRLVVWKEDDVENREQQLDMAVLGAILERLSEQEDARMVSVNDEYYAQCRNQLRRHGTDSERYPLTHPFPNVIRPSEVGWRLRYYHALFWEGGEDAVANACANYLEGVEWSLLYHTQRPVDWSWFYRHPYAPTALDLANHITANASLRGVLFSLSETTITHDDAPRASPRVGDNAAHVQLLMVLPLPSIVKYMTGRRSKFVDVATSLDRGCAHFYPTNFNVLTYLKRYVGECVPVLPVIDHEKVAGAYGDINRARKRPTNNHPDESLRRVSSCDTACARHSCR
jgi:5'-3' exonuclease